MNDEIRELIENVGWINAGFMIEVQGNDNEFVKQSLKNLVEKLKKERGIKVYEIRYDTVEEIKKNWFSALVEIKVVAKDFGKLVKVALLYSPSAFEIYEPKKELKIEVGEAQNILADVSSVVTSLAHTVFAQQGKIKKLIKGNYKTTVK